LSRALLAAVGVLLALPSAASAATAFADIHIRHGLADGPVRFTAAKGERNRLEISSTDTGQILFRDRRVRVRARGDCEQVGRHAAACPSGEELPRANLGDGADRAAVLGDRFELAEVLGGPGPDTLVGSKGTNILDGGFGRDVLRGGANSDTLTGGPGRDRVYGGIGDDRLIDGETDAQAAHDLLVGGSSRDTRNSDVGDTVSYFSRRRDIRIDLGHTPIRTSTEDALRGFESIGGGSGDDRLSGDRDDNQFSGGPGRDVLNGRGGSDIPAGGPGDDQVGGGSGNDVVWGDAGRDSLSGGDGDDFVIALEEGGPLSADRIVCGRGTDGTRSDRNDTLPTGGGCEQLVAFSNGLGLGTRPAIDDDGADFALTCFGGSVEGCHGTISLTGPGGRKFGNAHFDVERDAVEAPVSVPLTSAAVEALAKRTLVRVELVPDDADSGLEEPGGYRAFMRRG
jgi:Ca2+-binding RTX toxin-like protein